MRLDGTTTHRRLLAQTIEWTFVSVVGDHCLHLLNTYKCHTSTHPHLHYPNECPYPTYDDRRRKLTIHQRQRFGWAVMPVCESAVSDETNR